MSQRFLIHSHLLPKDAVQLGRLVSNIRSPQDRFLDCLHITASDFSTQRLNEYKEKFSNSGGLRLKAFLTSLLSIRVGGDSGTAIDIESASCITYQLRNCETWFETLLSESEEVKAWLGNAHWAGRKVYLVVGLKIVVDARVCEKEGRLAPAGPDLQPPTLATLANLVTGPDLPGTNPDVDFEIPDASNPRQIRQYTAIGEHIFAVQYRKIQFSWFFSRDIEGASLRGNRWKVYWGETRSLEEEEEEEDVLEAVAADPLGKGDFNQACESFQVGDEEFFYLS